jgi:hypothetical protein
MIRDSCDGGRLCVGLPRARRVVTARAWWKALVLALGALLVVRTASAEPVSRNAEPVAGDGERAEQLFMQGRASMKAHRYEEACAKFAESDSLDPASGTLLNLAACREAQGRTATAWTHYRDGLARSRTEANAEGERLALERIQVLEPLLCRLTIVGPNDAPAGLVMTLDAVRLPPEAWGTAVPVDPGTHVVEASAPERKAFAARVSVIEQGAARIVRIPDLERASAPVPGVRAQRASPVRDARLTPVRAEGGKGSDGVPTPTIVAGAVSIAGFSAAAYFGLRAKGEWDTRNEHCSDGSCDEAAVEASDDARTFAYCADAGLAVGLVAAGFAVYFALAGGQAKATALPRAVARLPLSLTISKEHARVGVGGTF